MQVIEVMATVRAAFGFVNRNLTTLLAIAWVPLAFNLLLLTADYVLVGDGNLLTNLLIFLLSAAINVPFLTAWHRITLMDGDRTRAVVRYAFRPAEIRFLGYALVFYSALYFAVIAVPFILLTIRSAAIPIGGGPLLYVTLYLAFAVALFLLFLKLSLVFPAAAVGHSMTFADSWRYTEHNVWAMFFVMVFIFLPLVLIGTILQTAVFAAIALSAGASTAAPGLQFAAVIALTIVLLAPSYYFSAVFISALSLMFRRLTGYDPASFEPEDITRR